MGMTMSQKILAKHAGLSEVREGQLIKAKLDMVLGNDITSPVAINEFNKAGFDAVFDKSKISLVMDHFTHPRNVGVIENADGVGEVGNAKCGDIMKIYLKIENDIIVDVKFETFGCGSAIASSSMATEMIMGKSIHEAMELTNKAVAEALDGLPAHKMHCSVLAEEAIKNALQDYFEKNNIPYDKSKFKEIDHDELHAQVHGDE